MGAILHIAGLMVLGVQRCTRCFAILLEVKEPLAQMARRGPDNPLRGFDVGAEVVLWRHPTDPPGDGHSRGSLRELFDGVAEPCAAAPTPGAVMHITGAYVDQRQLCARCGRVLIDNRGAMGEAGSGPPGHFTEGALLWQSGGVTSLIADNDDNTPPCRPVN